MFKIQFFNNINKRRQFFESAGSHTADRYDCLLAWRGSLKFQILFWGTPFFLIIFIAWALSGLWVVDRSAQSQKTHQRAADWKVGGPVLYALFAVVELNGGEHLAGGSSDLCGDSVATGC